MTEEEKKEFEEFLQWKKEKAEKEMAEKQSVSSNVDDESASNNNAEKEGYSSTSVPDSQENNFNMLPIIIAVLAIVALFVILGTCARPKQPTQENEEYLVMDSIEEVIDTVVADVEPSLKTWDFNIQKDPMTDTNNIWAQIQSDDYISQDFPYEGYTYASITCRYMKKYGYDVIVQISKGQINGRSYSGTNYVTARFDEGTAKKYYFDEAADGSSDHVFLRNSSDFMSRCKKAKEIIIDIPIYKSGRPAFSFHVDEPLVWRDK